VLRYYKEHDAFTISSCSKDDVDDVRVFLHDFWSKDHVLYTDREFLDWQYFNKRHEEYNFLLARKSDSGDLLGMVGYIPSYLYDYSISDADKFIWLTTWMVRPQSREQGGIGIKLLSTIPIYEGTRNVGTSGNYDSVIPMYKMMKYEIGILDHYFILNRNINEYKIAGVPTDYKSTASKSGQKSKVSIIDQQRFEDCFPSLMQKDSSEFPKKTKTFFINRYFKHPVYKYEAMLIESSMEPIACFIFRQSYHDGANVLRIVDGFGDFRKLESINDDIQEFLDERRAEYLDLYCKGIDCDSIIQAGFTPHSIDDEVIIPNFFEPFEMTNRNINYAYFNQYSKKYVIFKGDADQDRPNIYHPRG